MGREARLKKERLPWVVKAYVEAAKEILPAVFTTDCCLNGTRVCIEALRLHGVTAKPLVVDMMVANEKANRMFEQHDGWPTAEEDVRRWMAEGAWVLTVDGKDNGKDGWPHHLIADVGELLVDSALGQASRPAKTIELPWCAAFPRGGFAVKQSAIVYDASNGATIGYKARPDVRDYVRIAGFQRSPHNMRTAAAVAKKMHQLLEVT